MIKLERTTPWYRPYTVEASGSTYVLNNIGFYDNDGNVLFAGSGWLQTKSGMDIQCIELDTDKITRRNKVKFDGQVFGIPCKADYDRTKRLVLYIPMSMVNLTYECKKKMYGDNVYECYCGDQGIFITHFVESLDKDIKVVKDSYKFLLDKIGTYDMEKNPDAVIESLKEMIDVVNEYKEERAKIDAIIIEG